MEFQAHGLVEEFRRAHSEIKEAVAEAAAHPQSAEAAGNAQAKIAIWQPIIAKYNPTLIGECEKAIDWSEKMVENWLNRNMFSDVEKHERTEKVRIILKELGDHSVNKAHARHLSLRKCQDIGLKIIKLEDDNHLQDLVLSIHHSCIHTLAGTNAFKIIENQNGIAFIQNAQNIVLPR